MMPPKDVPASELFLKLLDAPSPSEVVEFPRRGPDGKPLFSVRIFVLSMADHHDARIAAHKWLQAKGLDVPHGNALSHEVREIYSDACARFVLQKAVRHTEPIKDSERTVGGAKYAYLFPDADSIDKVLSAPELVVLFAAYQAVQHKYGPNEELVRTEEELDAWIARLSEGASAVPFLRLDSPAVAELCQRFARRLSSISALLASHSRSLPSSLAADLAKLHTGSGFAGAPRLASPTQESSQSSSVVPSEPITLEQAQALAKLLFNRE